MTAQLLVLAKAPVPGTVKTRVGQEIGMTAAAGLAAAALADTLEVCTAAFDAERCWLALDGSLDDGVDGDVLGALLEGWQVLPQRGSGLAERIVNAHLDVDHGPVVQIGMDTPQVTDRLLTGAAAMLSSHDAVLGPALDGGWWVLGVRNPGAVRAISDVPMSTPTTGTDTRRALEAAGLRVAETVALQDVDTMPDAREVAALIPGSRFTRALAEL